MWSGVRKGFPAFFIEKSTFFEKALESAINKKKMDISQKTKKPLNDLGKESIAESKDSLKEENKKDAAEQFNVKCPKCSFIFQTKIQPEGVTKIKCPRCGKEGIIK